MVTNHLLTGMILQVGTEDIYNDLEMGTFVTISHWHSFINIMV